jgi:16S rRNA (uracil1498-N3)-methyltransferase
MTAPVFFASVGNVDAGGQIVLDGPEGHHAADVRRLYAGEAIDLTDGSGVLLHGVVAEVRRGELAVTVTERVVVPAPAPSFTVVQALAKGGRDEDAVEAMTEVGVDHVVGWAASRSIAKWTDRTGPKWLSTALAAAKQSRRAWWPTVTGPESTADVAARCAAASVAVVLHEAATAPLTSVAVPDIGEVVLVVGPEGGITDEELDALSGAGAAVVRLGSTVLRSSTAGVAALSVLSAASRWR